MYQIKLFASLIGAISFLFLFFILGANGAGAQSHVANTPEIKTLD